MMTRWKGVAVGIYRLSTGDVQERHRHAWEHTICLISGDAVVEIWDDPNAGRIIVLERDEVHVLPADIDHEFRALSDGTILLAIADDRQMSAPPPPPKRGGVLHPDGTVIYETAE